ncbi:MAG TPA: GMC family oxidoreductase, partial [Blastocatellia bacterium]|nr:GMC family oxidoreductase [Blastocatellia bacterium]
MNSSQHYDVIIIGTGAGGGTLVHKLAPSGKKILLLERGDYIQREKKNWDSRFVVTEGGYNTKEVWRDKKGKDLHPHTNYYVGGNTKFYGAALFRLREQDFEEIRHHGGVSPAWPIRYADLEPYYTQAENLYHVHGARGEDPTEPWASAPYPHPAVSHEPRIQQLVDDLSKHGYKPFHTPLGVMLNEQDRKHSACIRCNTCDGYPCLVNAKSDAQVIGVDPSLSYPNVTLLTGARVDRLETSPSGREITKVHVTRNGEAESYSANIIAVSCGAINSAALLLRSANDKHPNGLANGSDVVGRHYMGHINSVLFAISRHPNLTLFQKTMAINDFYFASKEWDFPMGHISFVGKFDANMFAAGAPPFAPHLTLEYIAKHSLDFWLTSEDLPAPANRVSVDRDGRINLAYTPNNLEGHKRLYAKVKEMVKEADCDDHLIPLNAFVGDRVPLAA